MSGCATDLLPYLATPQAQNIFLNYAITLPETMYPPSPFTGLSGVKTSPGFIAHPIHLEDQAHQKFRAVAVIFSLYEPAYQQPQD